MSFGDPVHGTEIIKVFNADQAQLTIDTLFSIFHLVLIFSEISY